MTVQLIGKMRRLAPAVLGEEFQLPDNDSLKTSLRRWENGYFTPGLEYRNLRPARYEPGQLQFGRYGSSAGRDAMSRWAVWRTSDQFAVRRRMTVLKPSTRGMSFAQRVRVPTLELATPLATVGRQRIWSLIEDVTILLAVRVPVSRGRWPGGFWMLRAR